MVTIACMNKSIIPLCVYFQVCDTWEAVRALDEAENWAERTRVLSKADHTELIHYAKVFVQ